MKHLKLLLLGPRQKFFLYLGTSVLWATGAWWLARPAPLWMKIHGAAAFVFLLVFGSLLYQHVPAGWAHEKQRGSGGGLIALCGTLILSGWGLYYFGNEDLRRWTSGLHSYLGLALPILITLHVWLGRRLTNGASHPMDHPHHGQSPHRRANEARP